jgi:hypothetical protein
MPEGYCVKERKKVEIQDPQQITMKNGRPAIQGTCPDCGTKIFKIGKDGLTPRRTSGEVRKLNSGALNGGRGACKPDTGGDTRRRRWNNGVALCPARRNPSS